MTKRVKTEERTKHKALTVLLDILGIVLGECVYSAGVYFFTHPNDIAPGGILGVATMINHGTGVSIGVLYGLINVPLVILGFIFLGKKMMLKTIFAVALVTVATDYLFNKFPVYTGDTMLAGIFGGLLIGIGLGIVYMREGTTGGTDIINKLINKAFPQFKLGVIMLAVDAVIVIATIIVFGSIESGLYSIVTIYVSSKLVDFLVYGSLEGKLVLIFSEKTEELTALITDDFHRGATLLDGEGAYSHKPRSVICVALHKNEYVKLKRKVKQLDPNAFMVTTTAGEVVGKGFQK